MSIKEEYFEGDCFGEEELLRNRPFSYSFKAIEETNLFRIKGRKLFEIIELIKEERDNEYKNLFQKYPLASKVQI